MSAARYHTEPDSLKPVATLPVMGRTIQLFEEEGVLIGSIDAGGRVVVAHAFRRGEGMESPARVGGTGHEPALTVPHLEGRSPGRLFAVVDHAEDADVAAIGATVAAVRDAAGVE